MMSIPSFNTARYRRDRGFPWCEFDIRESPTSRQLFGLKRRGASHPPAEIRPPLSRDQFKRLGLTWDNWQTLPLSFERVREILSAGTS